MLNDKQMLETLISNINKEVDKLIATIKNKLLKIDDKLKSEEIDLIYYDMEWHDTTYLKMYYGTNYVDTWELKNRDLAEEIDTLRDYCEEISKYLWLVRTSINDYRLTLWERN